MNGDKINLDFVVVGAQKSGTTTLHDMLAKHSDIALPVLKETHFFSHRDRANRGLQWYMDQFKNKKSASLRGEVDPEYMFSPDAAVKIRAMTDARKFIFILRHPLDRAFSHFQMSQRRGYESCSFGEALSKEEERLTGTQSDFARDHWSYSSRSLYSEQIQRFQTVFPDADFLFIRLDFLSHSGYDQICDFIDTQPIDLASSEQLKSNAANTPRSYLVRDILYAPKGKSQLRNCVVKFIPQSIKTRVFLWLDQQNSKPIHIHREQIYSGVPAAILASFADDLKQTQFMTGLDIADWIDDIQRRLQKSRS